MRQNKQQREVIYSINLSLIGPFAFSASASFNSCSNLSDKSNPLSSLSQSVMISGAIRGSVAILVSWYCLFSFAVTCTNILLHPTHPFTCCNHVQENKPALSFLSGSHQYKSVASWRSCNWWQHWTCFFVIGLSCRSASVTFTRLLPRFSLAGLILST